MKKFLSGKIRIGIISSIALIVVFIMGYEILFDIDLKRAHAQEYPAEWNSLAFEDLLRNARDAQEGAEGSPDLEQLAGFFRIEYISNPDRLAEVSTPTLHELVKILKDCLDESGKEAWANGIVAAYASTQNIFAEKPILDAVHIAETLDLLVDGEGIERFRDYYNARETLDIAPPDLRVVAITIQKLGKGARARLLNHINTNVLTHPDEVISVGLRGWQDCVYMLHREMPAQDQANWLQTIKPAFGTKEAIGKLTINEVLHLIRTCKWLGDSKANALLLVRESSEAGLDADSPGMLWEFMSSLARVDAADMELRTQFASRIAERFKSRDSETPLTWFECCVGARACSLISDSENMVAMGQRAYDLALGDEASRSAMSFMNLDNVIFTLIFTDLFRTDGDYTNVAKTFQLFSDTGKLSYDMSKPQWIWFINKRLRLTRESPDRQAWWLIAKGHAETYSSGKLALMQGEESWRQAMVIAESDEIKLTALRNLTKGYVDEGRHDLAISLIQSVASQFEESARAADVTALADSLATQQQQFTQQRLETKRKDRQAVQSEWETEMHRRLAAAVDRGDSVEAAKIRRMLGM